MEESRRIFRRPEKGHGPNDGVQLDTECVRTDFADNTENGEAPFAQREKSECHISASVELGTLSIRDMKSGVMLTVSLVDAVELIVTALETSNVVGTYPDEVKDDGLKS